MYAKYKLTNILKNDIENLNVPISVFLTSARIIGPSSNKIWRHIVQNQQTFFIEILERTAHAWLQMINHFDYVYYIPLKLFINNNKRISYILAWFLNNIFYSCSQITKNMNYQIWHRKSSELVYFLMGISYLIWLERKCGQFTSLAIGIYITILPVLETFSKFSCKKTRSIHKYIHTLSNNWINCI